MVCIISKDLILGDIIMSGRTDDRIAKDSLLFLCQFMGFHEKEVGRSEWLGPTTLKPYGICIQRLHIDRKVVSR